MKELTMTIKSIIFYSLLCTSVYVCAMNRQSIWDYAWEQQQKEKSQSGEPMPNGQTYEEAVRMHLKDKIQNEQAMREDMRKQRENKKNEADPK